MTNPPLTYSKKLKANILPMGNGNDTILRKWLHQPSEDTLFLEPRNHTEKHIHYTALTPPQNLKLESKSNHFFQKAPPAQIKTQLV